LAQELVTGLSANVAVYPSPPVSVMDLATTISAYISAKNAAIAAQAAAEQATSDKDDALENLTEAMKAEIRYVENTVNYDDGKLKLIGWAGRAARTDLALPGDSRGFSKRPGRARAGCFSTGKRPVTAESRAHTRSCAVYDPTGRGKMSRRR